MGEEFCNHNTGDKRTVSDRILIVFGIIACAALFYVSLEQLIMPIIWNEDYNEGELLQMTVVYFALLAIAVIVIRRIPERVLPALPVAMIVCAGLIQIYIAHEMQLLPEIDLYDIMNQNRSLVDRGEHIFTDRAYFSFYTNNIPIGIVVYWIYRIAAMLGSHNYELAGGLFNVAMNVLTYCYNGPIN